MTWFVAMQFNLFTTVGSSVGLEGEMVKIPIARNLLWTGKDLGPCAIEDFFFLLKSCLNMEAQSFLYFWTVDEFI